MSDGLAVASQALQHVDVPREPGLLAAFTDGTHVYKVYGTEPGLRWVYLHPWGRSDRHLLGRVDAGTPAVFVSVEADGEVVFDPQSLIAAAVRAAAAECVVPG